VLAEASPIHWGKVIDPTSPSPPQAEPKTGQPSLANPHQESEAIDSTSSSPVVEDPTGGGGQVISTAGKTANPQGGNAISVLALYTEPGAVDYNPLSILGAFMLLPVGLDAISVTYATVEIVYCG
jgi:hypothetical protein